MTQSLTCLVAGASGKLGRRVVELLLEREAGRVVAASRKPEALADLEARGAIVRKADFDEPSTLPAAFADVDRALIISTDAVGRRTQQHIAAIDAAVRAGVRHLAYTSVTNAEAWDFVVGREHYLTERAMEASGAAWTSLRNNIYTEMLLVSLPPAIATGRLVAAAGLGGAGFVTREDCARAAAAVLAAETPPSGAIDITGPEVVTFADLAGTASELTGTPVEYVRVTPDEARGALTAAGLPPGFADLLVAFDTAIADGILAVASPAVQQLTGWRPTSVAEFLTAHRDALVAAHAH
jgi:NAD(P)H dehydrogenase (quinone)